MGAKLALNVLYNIGIVIALFTGYWGVQHARYEFLVGAVFIAVVFVMLKVKLIKEVKEKTRQ